MSQPPPPTGNPPEFGKSDGAVPPPPGPPQTPPPPPGGGYGYPGQQAPAPQMPPPGGGYGYPAPQTPPPAANPYAQVPPGQNPYAQAPTQAAVPHQQVPQTPPPGPYGAPQQPQYPGQPQYGQVPPQGPYGGMPQQPYPGQPQYGQGAPGGGRNNNKLLVIIAAAVVAVLLVGVGVYFATRSDSGGDPKPKPTAQPTKPTASPHSSTLAFGWEKPADKVSKKDGLTHVYGVWFTDKYVVKQEIGKVVAYDLSTGAEAWRVPAASNKDGCAATKEASQNLAAIMYGPNCNEVMVIDLAAGKQKWTKVLPADDDADFVFQYGSMAISGDTLGVNWLSGSIGYRLSTQAVLWQSGNGTCEDDGYAGGKQFVAVVNCDNKTYKVQAIDPDDNGKPKWTWEAFSGFDIKAVVSTDPVVVLVGRESGSPTDLVAIDDHGKMRSRLSLGNRIYDIEIGENGMEDVHNVLVSKDTVYLTLLGQSDSNGHVLSGIAAFDLGTAKQRWVAKPADKQLLVGLDFLDDGRILGFEPPKYGSAGKMVAFDAATGAQKDYAAFSNGAEEHLDLESMHNDAYWYQGHLFLATNTLYQSDDDMYTYLVEYH